MPDELILGIDASTTAVKAVVFDAQGRVAGMGRAALPVHMPRPGWHEQSADGWQRALIHAIPQALTGLRVERLAGLAIANQRETFVPVDRHGKPLLPAILWMDERAADLLPGLEAALGGRDAFQRLTGKPLTANLTATKIAWIKQYEPEVFSQAAFFLDVQASLVHALTGAYATSWGSADPTGLFDTARGVWAAPVLEALELSPARLPALYPPGAVMGRVTPAAARRTGLPAGLPVIAGLGDGQAGGLGAAIVAPGSAYLSLGTSLITGTFSDHYATGPGFRTMTGGERGAYLFETVLLGGTYTLDWLLSGFLGKKGRRLQDLRREMEAALEQVPPGADGLVLVPYWNSVMNPYWDASASGMVIGWRGSHRVQHLYRAILEGLAMELRLHFAGVEPALDQPVERVAAMGGGANSPGWLQIIADVIQKPVYRTQTPEATALGAAVLAATGCGFYPSAAEAARQMSAWSPQPIRPRPEEAAFYTEWFERVYRPLYPAVREPMRELARIQAAQNRPPD